MDKAASYLHYQIAQNEVAYTPRVHYHPDYEVYYLTQGKCRYFIGDRTYHLNAGDIVVIPPEVIHKVIYESASHSRILLNCTADYIPPSVLRILPRLTFFSPMPDTARQLEYIYGRIRAALTQPDEFSQDVLHCCTMQLLLMMARSDAEPHAPQTGNPYVKGAVGYIQGNYMNKLTLQQTARFCAVSPEHLSRVFRQETGFGFNEYVNLYRLKKAEALLKSDSGCSISQVAYLCGFSDSNYFSSAYRKVYGIPPSHVRRSAKQK